MTTARPGQYPEQYFRRQDESPDPLFFVEPRLVVHIDDSAIAAIGDYFAEVLPRDGVLLDLMSSWRSHLPEGFPKKAMVGLGLNGEEMVENPQVDAAVIHDLNANPALPFADAAFDAVFVTVSVQYMTRPVEVFAEVRRVLRPGASFHVIYSNRMFPTKAVAIWQIMDDRQRGELVSSYFRSSGQWGDLGTTSRGRAGSYSDPVFVVSARKPRTVEK